MRQNLIAVGCGIAGMLLMLVLWHLWVDHDLFHAAINASVRQQQQQAAPKP